ncbi:hypothetical protein [Chryseobacterium sp.]|uniref:hypothetical protein n=1 Tax=Chryseobacterium sp. TaxID=1871047 RepID=UPI0028994459|nr:hypothetical protein [Chryseobacterium sp.]
MIAIKSNKKLKTPERVIQEGVISRKIDFFQINPDTNELSMRISEKCTDENGEVVWSSTFMPKSIILTDEIIQPIYQQFRHNLKQETESEKLFGCQDGDFDIIVE